MQAPGLITCVSPTAPVHKDTDPASLRTLGDRLLWARLQRGLSQPALAKQAGCTQGTIGNVESGLRSRPRNLIAIAKALEVPPDWLENGGHDPRMPQQAQLPPLTVADAIKAEAQQDPYELIERGLRALVIVGDDFKAVMAQVRELAAKSEVIQAAVLARIKEADKNGSTTKE